MQEHDGALLMSWQIELGPQGDGTHGFTIGSTASGGGAKTSLE